MEDWPVVHIIAFWREVRRQPDLGPELLGGGQTTGGRHPQLPKGVGPSEESSEETGSPVAPASHGIDPTLNDIELLLATFAAVT